MAELHKIISGSTKQDCDVGISQDLLPGRDCAGPQNSGLLRRRHHRYRGVALIWVAIVLLVLILFVGLTIDTAKVSLVLHQLQNAADAAALAGAQLVKTDQAQARIQAQILGEANYYADGNSVKLGLNSSNAEDGDIVIGLYFPQYDSFVPSTVAGQFANAVKVVPRCIDGQANPPVALIFGPIAKVDTVDVTRYAIAMSSGGTGAGLIALACNDTTGLETEGGTVINVNNGEVQVNCDSCEKKPAIDASNNSEIEALQINVVGCYDGPDVNAPIVEGANTMPDPLGCYPDYDCLMPPPPYYESNDLSPAPGDYWIPDPCVPLNILSPGYYSGGINVTNSTANVRFEPGIYILDGEITDGAAPYAKGGLNLTGGTFDANDGVMFYILGGSVDIGGGAQMNMTELVPWEDDNIALPYEGMLIYQDPYNTSPARIIGTSNTILVGTIYFPFNHLDVGGEGYSVGTQLIVESIKIHTSGEGVVVNYDGRNRAPGGKSYLVK